MMQRIINELRLPIIVIDLQKQRQKEKQQLTSAILNKTNDTMVWNILKQCKPKSLRVQIMLKKSKHSGQIIGFS